MNVKIRELQASDIEGIIAYFQRLSAVELVEMGIDSTSLKLEDDWKKWFEQNLYQSLYKVAAYFLIWDIDDVMVGFTFVDRIVYGRDAYMHMYLIQPQLRKSGHGQKFMRQSTKALFNQFKFDELYCEPSAINTEAQRALQACGFKYVKTHNKPSPDFAYKVPLSQWRLTS
jgi:RimJ/RimL family protein N-acetyltransferase